MRITGIEIERFGVWQNYRQPLNREGLTVFYGPNEAGKTTLLRFIRGVLYGFPPDDQLLPNKKKSRRESQSGLLRVEHRGREFEIRRSGYGEDPGVLSVNGVPSGESTTTFMEELLASTDEKLFESVFAVGLPELQQFATLTADQVGNHLYGMTLGPQGRVLMELPNRANGELHHLLSNSGHALIPALMKRHEELLRQSASVTRQRDRYRDLLRKKTELDDRIIKQRARQGELQSNLRGFSHLEKVHPPWARCREFRRELNTLPDFSDFPSDGVARIERLERDIDSATQAREVLLSEISHINHRLASIRIDPEIRRFSGAVQIVVEQRALTKDIEPRVYELDRQANAVQHELNDHLVALGPQWSLSRLDSVQDSPESHARFVQAARSYQAVHTKTRRMQRRYRKANIKIRDTELSLRTELQSQGVPVESLNESIKIAQERLGQLVELGRWHSRASQLEQQTIGIDEQLERLNDRNGIPDWIFGILAWFTIAGFGLCIAGIYAAVYTGWLVGLIFILLSVFAGGTAWAFRNHFERNLQEQVARLREQRRNFESDRWTILSQVQAYIDQTGMREWWGQNLTADDLASGDLLAESARRTANLERVQREFVDVLQIRRRLSAYRGQLQLQQRELGNARKNWCQMLAHLGFDETVDVETAFAHWKRVIAARDRRRKHLALLEQSRDVRLSFDRFRNQVESLGHRMHRPKLNYQTPSEVVDLWEQELRTARELLNERKQLRKQSVLHRREAAEWMRKMDGLRKEHLHLLTLAGVSQRSQLDHRLELMERRNQVESLLELTTRELEQIVSSQPDISFVEDDLLRYNPKDAAGLVKQFNREHEELEHLLQQTFEQLGTIKQELKQLENDRRGTRVRRELANVEHDLKTAWHTWFSASLAEDAIQDVAAQFEQANQPEMLAAAIPFLQKLTLGKYHHLWTPLGRKQLFVDDNKNDSQPAERLSGGTREQLFLSIRLAMVKAFAKNNVDLPMVLDDVTVNFDVDRSDAAVETLLDFTSDGQQLLVFTSHLHYAQLFEKRGVKPIYLPSRHPSTGAVEERRAG
ncbi:AAA family ATPase [Schlesneria paludicola]|uniref:AAA family ATPase n=1 Tax=Schlesneria paludicola TaxID=360056 RepID=UPI00029A0248|nr:AAA family ATPase [Schlesneria paludicola]